MSNDNLSNLFIDQSAVTQNPIHLPDSRTRNDVTYWSGIGMRYSEIARLAKMSKLQLQEHYREELALGPAEANRQVCENLFNLAVSPRHPTVAMFWAKARCGFRTTGSAPLQFTSPIMAPPRIGSSDDHARYDF